MLIGESVKEKKAAASFDITAIFLLVMQIVVGAQKALHWTQGFVLFDAECGAYMGQITPLDLRRTTMLDVSVNSNRLLSGVLLGDLCHL